MTYRIYWLDLDDYSEMPSDDLNWVIEHGEYCKAPFVVVDDWGFPEGIVYPQGGLPRACTSVGVLPEEPRPELIEGPEIGEPV